MLFLFFIIPMSHSVSQNVVPISDFSTNWQLFKLLKDIKLVIRVSWVLISVQSELSIQKPDQDPDELLKMIERAENLKKILHPSQGSEIFDESNIFGESTKIEFSTLSKPKTQTIIFDS